MPLYQSKCLECGKQQDYISKIAYRHDSLPICCGQKTELMIVPPMVGAMSFVGHKGMRLAGQWCEDGSQYKRLMRQNNWIPEADATQEAKIQNDNIDKVNDKKLQVATEKAAAEVFQRHKV
jgi:hypothetical protein